MSKVLGNMLPNFGLNAEADVGIGGSYTASNNDTQSLTDETASQIDNSHIVAYSTLETALSSEHYANNSAKDQQLANDLRAGRETTNQLAHTAEIRSEDLRSYGSNITNSDTKEVIITHEARDDVIEQMHNSHNIHHLEAHRALDRGDKIANQSLKAKGSEAKQETEGAMQSAKQYFTGDGRDEAIIQFKEEHRGKVSNADNSNQDQVRQNAAQAGVTEDGTDKTINDAKVRAETKAADLTKKANEELEIKEKAIVVEREVHKEKAKEAEAKRKFRGTFGRKNNHG
jgi:hypothetical protein